MFADELGQQGAVAGQQCRGVCVVILLEPDLQQGTSRSRETVQRSLPLRQTRVQGRHETRGH